MPFAAALIHRYADRRRPGRLYAQLATGLPPPPTIAVALLLATPADRRQRSHALPTSFPSLPRRCIGESGSSAPAGEIEHHRPERSGSLLGGRL